jgi:signal transduction histidine kinase
LVESMSDIVWAINPRKDQLSELSHRMRRFASDIFTARNISFHFHVPRFEDDMQLGANLRREIFLIFKESVNNVVKHSNCSEASAEFYTENGCLMLEISDNGEGFDAARVSDASFSQATRGGNGLPGMQQRAAELGGQFRVSSAVGKGTKISLTVPIAGRISASGNLPTLVGGDGNREAV